MNMEARRWTHLPTDANIVGIATVHTNIDIALDPVFHIEEGTAEADTIMASYLHSFGFLGKTARLDVRVPYKRIEWKGKLNGVQQTINREGLGDPLIRLSVNFFGAPALTGEDYRAYRTAHTTTTVAGASLGVIVPLGQYKKSKLLNIGQNRYIIRPQLGIVHIRGSWSYEVTGTLNFFTDNHDFFGGKTREQKLLLGVQSHIVHTFKNRMWASLSAGYDNGGETTVDGDDKHNRKEDAFFSLGIGIPVTRTASIKLGYVGGRTQKDIGNDVDHFILSFSNRF